MPGPEQNSLFDFSDDRRVAEDRSGPDSETGPEVLSVGELNRRVNGLLQDTVGTVWVEGELSGTRYYRSGGWRRVYGTLKDAEAEVGIVIWPETLDTIRFDLEDGMKVLVEAEATLYTRRGAFQLVIRSLKPAGVGDLELAFQQLKQRLGAEGLFDEDAKQPVPLWPFRVGVVTSLQAAALRDFLQITARRNPAVTILIAPAAVQGAEAAAQIVSALASLARVPDLDCVVLTRGGGSIEDLWPFNEESVARAIHACPLPVISAVGHEIDWTISDLVADLRLPTPSAAAEHVAWPAAETQARIRELNDRMAAAVSRRVGELAQRVRWFGRAHGFQQMSLFIREQIQRLDDSLRRLPVGLRHRLEVARERLADARSRLLLLPRTRLDQAAARLTELRRTADALGPVGTLARGYAIIRRPVDGTIVRAADEAGKGEHLEILVHRGSLAVTVEGRGPGLDHQRLDETVNGNDRATGKEADT